MLALVLLLAAAPPKAPPREPVTREAHGDVRIDEHAWLSDRDDPAVRRYLRRENRYTRKVTRPLRPLVRALLDDLDRYEVTEATVPARVGAWWYHELEDVVVRWPDADPEAEEVVLDFARAGGEVVRWTPSPDGRRIAWLFDEDGDEATTLVVRDLETGRRELVPDAHTDAVWSADGASIYYTRVDDTFRGFQLRKHVVGSPDDVVVYEEPDGAFYVWLEEDRRGRYAVVTLESQVTTELRLLDLETGALETVRPRVQGVFEDLVEAGDRWFVRTNDAAVGFRLLSAPAGTDAWEAVPLPGDVAIDAIDGFAGHLVAWTRAEGAQGLAVLELASNTWIPVATPEPPLALEPVWQPAFEADRFLVHASGPLSPGRVEAIDLATGERRVVAPDVAVGFDASRYVVERLVAPSADGAFVPVTIVRRADREGPGPVYLTGYGAYGVPWDPAFDPTIFPLLDRGVAVAVAHVRGGGDLGPQWWLSGKLDQKSATFGDFIAAAEHLRAAGHAGGIAVSGMSAGGLLIGASINARPDLFDAAVLRVPFVDVMTTMSDPSLPLTRIEWEEWGDPRRAADYGWMRAWSPYDNVRAADYPDVWLTGAWHDSSVSYWEPAKLARRLRERRTDAGLTLLSVDFAGGHQGYAGGGELESLALEWAFVLDRLAAP